MKINHQSIKKWHIKPARENAIRQLFFYDIQNKSLNVRLIYFFLALYRNQSESVDDFFLYFIRIII